jgi:hypothetical protein
MPTLLETVKIFRQSNRVLRCHASPKLTHYDNSVHVCGMLDLLMLVYPDAPSSLYRKILLHDKPERTFGDIPHPAKDQLGQDFKINLNRAENDWFKAWGVCYPELSSHEEAIFKTLDLVEFFLWCEDELRLGNSEIESKIKEVVSVYFPKILKDKLIPLSNSAGGKLFLAFSTLISLVNSLSRREYSTLPSVPDCNLGLPQ